MVANADKCHLLTSTEEVGCVKKENEISKTPYKKNFQDLQEKLSWYEDTGRWIRETVFPDF